VAYQGTGSARLLAHYFSMAARHVKPLLILFGLPGASPHQSGG
jgi:hypothetical protein